MTDFDRCGGDERGDQDEQVLQFLDDLGKASDEAALEEREHLQALTTQHKAMMDLVKSLQEQLKEQQTQTNQALAQNAKLMQLIAAGAGNTDAAKKVAAEAAKAAGATAQVKKERKLMFCKHCGRMVMHAPSECYELEKNAAKRPAWWKSTKK